MVIIVCYFTEDEPANSDGSSDYFEGKSGEELVNEEVQRQNGNLDDQENRDEAVEVENPNVGSDHDESEPEEDVDDVSDESGESDDSEGNDGMNDDGDNDDALYNDSPVSLPEFMLAILAFFIRHKLTGQCLGDLLSLIAMVCSPGNRCVKTLYKFKKYFSMIGKNIVEYHYFCAGCEGPLETEIEECVHCGPGQKVDSVSYTHLTLPTNREV